MTQIVMRSSDQNLLEQVRHEAQAIVDDLFEKAKKGTGTHNMTAPQNKSFPVSWDQFHRDSRALAWRLMNEEPFDAIVCITRGGLVPAAIIARELGVRVIESVSIKSYDYKDQGQIGSR